VALVARTQLRTPSSASRAEPAQLSVSVPEAGPRPPCGSLPIPDYPGLNDPAIIKSWSRAEAGNSWRPPACTNWSESGFATLITVTARFAYSEGQESLLRRIGAISQLAGLPYWSTTHKQWRTLVLDAHAVSNPSAPSRREDFAPEEIKPGRALYFEQADNLSGKVLYRIQILEAKPDRIVLSIENADTIRYHFLPIFHAQELQSVYFLDRESDQVWRFYSMQRTAKNASRLAANESSSMNRAAAFYRHLAGIPPTQEPPAAR
jgi:hypothetical protein